MPHKRAIRWSMLSTALLSVVRFPSAVSAFSVGSVQRARQSSRATLTTTSYSSAPDTSQSNLKANLLTISLPELEELVSAWGYPKYRAGQIQGWVREKGVVDFEGMKNLPKALRETLKEHVQFGALHLEVQLESKDGTVKRAYKLWDGQLIESVLMPYEDGRNTACISSQAGCAMACEFCATGQMGFARQLTPDEIFEQVARFHAELKGQGERLSNIVFMGMGEPLGNYRNVMAAIHRINDELGIGARKITVSTVGVVPNIRKLAEEDLQVRLAVSLHCSSDDERSELMPANKRYGGLDELMTSVREYIDKTNRRVTFEWALIEGQNDTPSVARRLGQLLKRHGIRRDMAHINIIPLNPTGGFGGAPSGRRAMEGFVNVLEKEFGISATPRMRRGIDIEAGCGQLKAVVEKKKKDMDITDAATVEMTQEFQDAVESTKTNEFSVDIDFDAIASKNDGDFAPVEFLVSGEALDLDEVEGEVIDESYDTEEANRLISLVQSSFQANQKPDIEPSIDSVPEMTTKITDEEDARKASRRRKKLKKQLKAIDKLKDMQKNGKVLNGEQRAKVVKEQVWIGEIESITHNLQ